jgi:SAM-dependent methyltransferase
MNGNGTKEIFTSRTPHMDRFAIHQQVMARDVQGLDVLVVGCGNGDLCLEMVARGAARVTGVDRSLAAIHEARANAGGAHSAVTFHTMDVDREFPQGSYDLVVCLDLLHQSEFPFRLLQLLSKATRKTLLIEAVGPKDPFLVKRLKASGVSSWMRRRLAGKASCFILDRRTRLTGPVYLTPAAIRKVLVTQNHCFEKIEIKPTPVLNRFLVTAGRRALKKVVIIAGPDAAGKSTLARQLLSGESPEIADLLGLEEPESWTYAPPQDLDLDRILKAENLILHYSLLRPRKGYIKTFEADHVFSFLAAADSISFITLWVEPEVLSPRIARRLEYLHPTKRRMGQEQVFRFYQDRTRVTQLYEEWFHFCRSFESAEHWVIEDNGKRRIRPLAQWSMPTPH